MITLAIVGRPNVGKSTLFNRFVGKAHALVHETPGLTRDCLEGVWDEGDFQFRVLDTPGYEGGAPTTFSDKLWELTQNAIAQADVVVWIVDATAPLFPLDHELSRHLRKLKGKKLILLANKCEGQKSLPGLAEAEALNLGSIFEVSGLHGTGLADVASHIFHNAPKPLQELSRKLPDDVEEEGLAKPLQLTILGRPNVGKSTYLNSLLGHDRALAGPEAGLTRDALFVDWTYEKQSIRLVDTAGIRKRSSDKDTLETMSVEQSFKAVQFSHVVILLIDGLSPLDQQEMKLIQHVLKEGRGLVLAMNKWDLVEDKDRKIKNLRLDLAHKFPEIHQIPLVPLSAKNKKHLYKPIEEALEVYAQWNKRISTGKLNQWLSRIEARNPAPLVKGRQNRLKYASQINTRPPTFTVYTSQPMALPQSYKRYIRNQLAETFGFTHTPVRVLTRGSNNPYEGAAKKKRR